MHVTVHWSCPFQCWPAGTFDPWGQAETMAQLLGGVVRPCNTLGIWPDAMMHHQPGLETDPEMPGVGLPLKSSCRVAPGQGGLTQPTMTQLAAWLKGCRMVADTLCSTWG